jgi:hypothetical protein
VTLAQVNCNYKYFGMHRFQPGSSTPQMTNRVQWGMIAVRVISVVESVWVSNRTARRVSRCTRISDILLLLLLQQRHSRVCVAIQGTTTRRNIATTNTHSCIIERRAKCNNLISQTPSRDSKFEVSFREGLAAPESIICNGAIMNGKNIKVQCTIKDEFRANRLTSTIFGPATYQFYEVFRSGY